MLAACFVWRSESCVCWRRVFGFCDLRMFLMFTLRNFRKQKFSYCHFGVIWLTWRLMCAILDVFSPVFVWSWCSDFVGYGCFWCLDLLMLRTLKRGRAGPLIFSKKCVLRMWFASLDVRCVFLDVLNLVCVWSVFSDFVWTGRSNQQNRECQEEVTHNQTKVHKPFASSPKNIFFFSVKGLLGVICATWCLGCVCVFFDVLRPVFVWGLFSDFVGYGCFWCVDLLIPRSCGWSAAARGPLFVPRICVVRWTCSVWFA